MSNSQLYRLADRVINRPLLILPDKLAIVTEVLSGRIGIDSVRSEFEPLSPDGLALAHNSLMQPEANRFVGDDAEERDARGRALKRMPYRRTESGVGIITITGSLVNRGAWVGANSGLTSYEGIAHQIQSALDDSKVKCILLDIDSPGGEATGAFETAALVRQANAVKPVHAMVNGMAASAAYAIASGCKTIHMSESGIAGSIGVVLMHTDVSRAADRAGITPTLIHAGAHKVDGNPYQPLTKEVKADLQAEVDKFYELFIDTVAAGRGRRLSAKAARATEARTFIGRAAQEAGLIDGIGSFAELIGSLSRAGTGAIKRTNKMAVDVYSEDDIARAKAEGKNEGVAEGRKAGYELGLAEGRAEGVKDGHATGLAEGMTVGADAERARIKSILNHPEAVGRETSANHLALNTSMSVEDAAGVLAGVAKTTGIAARAANTVVAHNADVGAVADGDTAAAPKQAGAVAWDDIAAKLNAEVSRRPGAAR